VFVYQVHQACSGEGKGATHPLETSWCCSC